MRVKLLTLAAHRDAVTAVRWAQDSGTLLASAGNDRKVMLWDLAQVGKALSDEELEDGPAELLFIHAGHTAAVSDLAWNPAQNLTLASVSEDNILHVWQVSNSVFNF
jgi:histone-binding protein RBBP4